MTFTYGGVKGCDVSKGKRKGVEVRKSPIELFVGRFWIELDIVDGAGHRWEFVSGLTNHEVEQKAIARINELMGGVRESNSANTGQSRSR